MSVFKKSLFYQLLYQTILRGDNSFSQPTVGVKILKLKYKKTKQSELAFICILAYFIPVNTFDADLMESN